jgi:hypothetical protein
VRFAAKFVLQKVQKKLWQSHGKRHSGLPRNFAAALPRLLCDIAATFFPKFLQNLPRIYREFTTNFAANLPRVFLRVYTQV